MAPAEQIYSFTDFSTSRPSQQPPGDRLDAQFENHRAAIQSLQDRLDEIFGSGNVLPAHSVHAVHLDPALVDFLEADLRHQLDTTYTALSSSASVAQSAAITATTQASLAGDHARLAAAGALEVSTNAGSALAAALAAGAAAVEALDQARIAAAAIQNARDGVEEYANESQLYAEAAQAWADYMPGPIPPSILTIMGVTGDHWSSRWWANQADQLVSSITDDASRAETAAAAAETSAADAAAAADAAEANWDDFDDRYLGPKPSPPTFDNDGDPLQEGTIYFDTTNDQTYIWNGTSWQSVTSAGSIFANTVIFAPDAPTGISSTNVQAAIVEVATERATVVALNTEISDRTADVNAEESARIAADSALQTDIDTKATSAALAAEVTARQNADTTLTTNLATETTNRQNADTTLTTNLNSEITNRQNADTALQADINTRATTAALNTEITNRVADVDSEEAARIAADALKVDKTSNTGAAVMPAGTTGQRPGSPASGYVRYNSTTGKFEGYASAWGTLGGGAAISDTPPSNPSHGDLWWESDTGNLYIRFDDGSSAQWVQINYSPSADYGKLASLKSRTNMLYNGGFAVSQAANYVAVTASGSYPADGWIQNLSPLNGNSQVVNGQGVLQQGEYRMRLTCTTAKPSLAATDVWTLNHPIEGNDLYPARWGSTIGVPLLLRFGFKGPAGTYGWSIFNGATNVFWMGSFTVAAGDANVDKIYFLQIPAPPNGTAWGVAGNTGMTLRICFASGSTYTGTPGWTTNVLGPSNQFNGLSSTSNLFELFDVNLVPDFDNLNVDPGYIEPDAATGLERCQRYYIRDYSMQAASYHVAGSPCTFPVGFPTVMRTTPAVIVRTAGAAANCSGVTLSPQTNKGGVFYYTVTGTGGANCSGWVYDLNAQMT